MSILFFLFHSMSHMSTYAFIYLSLITQLLHRILDAKKKFDEFKVADKIGEIKSEVDHVLEKGI